jgi:PAS domain S-box-containing protein
LMAKVDALARINDDMNNLLNSMQVATIFLDTRLRVKRYTEQARDVVRLISTDIGRPLSDLTSNLRYDALIEDCERVLATLIPLEKEIQNNSGRWYLVRLIPYRTAENVIEGLVMTTVDIDRTKQAEESLRESLSDTKERESVLSAMIDHIPMGIIIADAPDVTIRAVSRFGRDQIGLSDNAIVGMPVDQVAQRFEFYGSDGKTSAPNEELPLTRATQQGEIIRDEVWILGSMNGAKIPILCAAGPIRDADGSITGGVIGWQDITQRKRAEENLRRSEEKYNLMFESIDEGFCIVEVIFDERDNPVDYRFLEMNPSFERLSGLTDARGKTMRELAPEREERLLQIYARIARTGEPERFENCEEQTHRWYEVSAWRYGRPEDRQVAILLNDITARKEAKSQAGSEPESQR